jgi:hypothetical protein
MSARYSIAHDAQGGAMVVDSESDRCIGFGSIADGALDNGDDCAADTARWLNEGSAIPEAWYGTAREWMDSRAAGEIVAPDEFRR